MINRVQTVSPSVWLFCVDQLQDMKAGVPALQLCIHLQEAAMLTQL